MTAGEGLTVTQRRYVSAADAHYGGNLVDGAYVLALFGDVATEACIRMDGDEGLFASYSDVQFRAPVLGGDVIETTATVLDARIEESSDNDGRTIYRPAVRIRYSVAGQPYDVWTYDITRAYSPGREDKQAALDLL